MTELRPVRWGLVSTIKADLADVVNFAAWHLELGAHRLFLYLDTPHPEAEHILKTHPKIWVLVTDEVYWDKRGGRPAMHQPRQSKNARHAYRRAADLDWITHIDVDEFLLPRQNISGLLADMPQDVQCLRIRPIEALDGQLPDGTQPFKAFHIPQKDRQAAAKACFPNWGAALSGGFLSHVAGKLFMRTGLKGLQIKIHNVILDGVQNPQQIECPDIELGHFHAGSWEKFLQHYRYRLASGSYRAELKPQSRQSGALSHYDLFRQIETTEGEAGLRVFYDELCKATPDLIARLEKQGLLRFYDMDFAPLVQRHFDPDASPT